MDQQGLIKKRCIVCNKLLPLEKFYKNKGNKDKRQNLCKDCDKEQSANYYKKNSNKIIKRHWRWIENNREKHNQIAYRSSKKRKQEKKDEYKI